MAGGDPKQWCLIKDLGEHGYYVMSVAWSPDGTKVLSKGADQKLKLWSVAGGDPRQWCLIKDLGEHGDEVTSVAWSPDGSKVLSGGADNKLKL